MTSCPLYNNSNLDSTGNKMNNPYALIQRAGKYKKRISKKNISKTRKTNKMNKPGKKRSYKKRTSIKNTKKVRFSKKLFFYKRM